MLYADKVKKKAVGTTPEPERKNEYQKKIEYVDIVVQMSDEAFQFCLDKIFPFFNYYVIRKEDIRRIDLEELLVKMQNKYYKNNKNKNKGFLNYYLDMLRKYYELLVDCVDRADMCRARGYEVINNAVSKNGTLYDIEDSLILLLCLFREKSNSSKVICEVDISVDKTDVDLIDKLVEYKIQNGKNVIKKPGILEKLINDDDDTEFDIKALYINSIIFFSICMQDRGIIE